MLTVVSGMAVATKAGRIKRRCWSAGWSGRARRLLAGASAQASWCAVNAPHLVALVRAGAPSLAASSPNDLMISPNSMRPEKQDTA
jgi:hypothetical protein